MTRRAWVTVAVLAVLGSSLALAGRALFAAENRPARPPVAIEDPKGRDPGNGPIVAVIDTGVDARHSALKDQCLPGINVAEPDQACDDPAGHGTAIAGLIASAEDDPEFRGVCTAARILPVKVSPGDSREALPAMLAFGIEKALDAKASVICIAMGASRSSKSLDEALDRAKKEGVLVVAAAGVSDGAADLWPAMHPWVVSCTVSELRLTRLPGNDKDTMVDYPASRAHVSGKTELIGSGFAKALTPGGGHGTLEGSSVACARAAGVAAQICLLFPKATAEERRRLLTLSGAPLEAANIFYSYPARRFGVEAATAVALEKEATDLALTYIDVNPGPLEAGKAGKLEFSVTNIGFAPAAGEVTFDAPEERVSASAKFEAIGPGQTRVVTVDLPVLKETGYRGVGRIKCAANKNAANDALNVMLDVRVAKEGPSLMCFRPRLTRLRLEDRKAVVEFEVQNAREVAFEGDAAVSAGDVNARVPVVFRGRETRTVAVEINLPELEEGFRKFELGVGVLKAEETVTAETLIVDMSEVTVTTQYADAWGTKEVIMDAPAFVLEGRSSIPVLLFAPEVNTMIDSDLKHSRKPPIDKSDRARGLWLYDITLEEVSADIAQSVEFDSHADPAPSLGGHTLLHVEGAKEKHQRLPERTVRSDDGIFAESGVGKALLDVQDLIQFVEEDGWSNVINIPITALKANSEPYVYLRGVARYLDHARNPDDPRWVGWDSGSVPYQTMLRVRLHAALPKLESAGQYYDIHVHTQCEFSRDAVEPRLAWGGPLWMLVRSAHAMGFVDDEYLQAVKFENLAAVAAREMLFTTDHNCFLTDKDTPFALPFRSGEAEITTLRRFVGKGANQELAMAPKGGRPLGAPHALTYGVAPLEGPWHGGRKFVDGLRKGKTLLEGLKGFKIPELVGKLLPEVMKILRDKPTLRGLALSELNKYLEQKKIPQIEAKDFEAICRAWADISAAAIDELVQQADRVLSEGAAREEANDNSVEQTEPKLAKNGTYIAAHPMTDAALSWDLDDLDRAANLVGGPFVEVQQEGRFPFAGVQVWNEERLRLAKLDHPDKLRQFNPWKRQAMAPNNSWHEEWARGFLHYENRLAKPGMMFTFDTKESRRKYFIRKLYHYAGSDAHGSFNFTTGVGATLLTNKLLMPLLTAFGQSHGTETSSSHFGCARVYAQKPAFEEVYRGRVVCTDGPLVWFDVDSDVKFDAKALTWHESWEAATRAQDVDGQIGGDGVFDGGRTALVRRNCDEMVLRYRVAAGGPLAPAPQRVDCYKLALSDQTARKEIESRGQIFVPRPESWWKPAKGEELQFRALKPWAPDGPALLFLGGFSVSNDESDDRFDVAAKRCFTNPVWLTTVEIGASARPVVVDGKAFVPKGAFVATFRADHSMRDEAPMVVLKQFNQLGDSIAATYKLVPVPKPDGIWTVDPREIGGEKVDLDDAFMVAVNDQDIPLGPPWFPKDGVDTFAVILAGAKDMHGNAYNAISGKIEIGVPAGTVIEPDPPSTGDTGSGPAPDTATVCVKSGEEVQLPRGATFGGKTIPPGAWTVPDLPEAGLPVVVATGGQTLTVLLSRSAAKPQPFLARTDPGFYGAAPTPGTGVATVTIKNHATKTVETADPVFVGGGVCVFSAPQAGPGACEVTVTQGAATA
ncbi:MAG: S8 family serine peptidase, partial [Planctomycetes bacterium]|nr:S8 family serine peptidase [Planctomycetota bacterium]